MTRRRLGTLIPLGILLLSMISCAGFMDPVKPTQVVDIAPMVGKSLQEMTALLGEPKPSGICHAWDLPEGQLIACYRSGDHAKKLMETIHYQFPPTPLFGPSTAVSSPEEMATLVKIDLQGRKPDSEFRGGYGYDDLILNGKAVDVAFDGGPKRIVGVRVNLKSSSAPAATNNPQTNSSIPPSTTGVTMANFNRLQKGMTYAQAVQILGKEGKKEGVMESGGIKIETYKWDADEDGSDATMTAFFKNGRLDTKFQFALK